MTDSQNIETDGLLRSASALGFFCEKDKQQNWRIYARGHQDNWYLQQDFDRWLLVINGVPQIWFQGAEVIAFIKRRDSTQQKKVLGQVRIED